MAEFYYSHILGRKAAAPVPSDGLVNRTCIVCGLPFRGTRVATLCSAACKRTRKLLVTTRWRKKHAGQ